MAVTQTMQFLVFVQDCQYYFQGGRKSASLMKILPLELPGCANVIGSSSYLIHIIRLII